MIMATKNFENKSSRTLEAMLNKESLNDEDRKAIETILLERQAQPIIVEIEPEEETEPTAEDLQEQAKKEQEAQEREELVKTMYESVGLKCEVVAFNTVDWFEAVITGVMDDKRAKSPMWVCRAIADGSIIRKAYGSQLIKISTERVELPKRMGSRSRQTIDKTAQEIAEDLNVATSKIGHFAQTADGNGVEQKALIVGAFHEKRSNRVMWRLRREDNSTFHKVFSTEVNVLDEQDAKVFEQNAERREKAELLANNPDARKIFIKEDIADVESKIAQLQEQLNAKLKELEDVTNDEDNEA